MRCTIQRGSFFVRINTFETSYCISLPVHKLPLWLSGVTWLGWLPTFKGVCTGGLGLNPPLELENLQKLYYLRKRDCFHILFAMPLNETPAWKFSAYATAYVVAIFNVVRHLGISSVFKILVQRTFFSLLRSVFTLALGLFWLPLYIFCLYLFVFVSIVIFNLVTDKHIPK